MRGSRESTQAVAEPCAVVLAWPTVRTAFGSTKRDGDLLSPPSSLPFFAPPPLFFLLFSASAVAEAAASRQLSISDRAYSPASMPSSPHPPTPSATPIDVFW